MSKAESYSIVYCDEKKNTWLLEYDTTIYEKSHEVFARNTPNVYAHEADLFARINTLIIIMLQTDYSKFTTQRVDCFKIQVQ